MRTGYLRETHEICAKYDDVATTSLDDDANGDRGGMNRELLRLISLPVDVDAAGVTCEQDDSGLAVRLPLTAGALTCSKSACV